MLICKTICVYGNFKEKDIRLKIFKGFGTECFHFQNILLEAGYDADLFTVDIDVEVTP